MNESARPVRSRYLVVHDYGMGGLWWWIRALSAERIVDTCAEVEVVIDPEAVTRAGTGCASACRTRTARTSRT